MCHATRADKRIVNIRMSRLRAVAVVICTAITALVVFTTPGSGDYVPRGPVAGDNAGPALAALGRGDVAGSVSRQPLMGLTSLFLRLPAVGVVSPSGGSGELANRLGAVACLLPLAVLCGYGLARIPARAGDRARRGASAALGVVALLALAGPATTNAVEVGHPEEMLAITLATAAVFAARADRRTSAALLLGLAIGTKPWALLATLPVALALPGGQRRTLGMAALVALPLTAIAPLLDPAAYARAGTGVGGGHLSDPLSLWWPFGSVLRGIHGTVGTHSDHRLPFGVTRSVAACTAVIAALAAVALATLRANSSERRLDPLALLALLGLIRCAVDPVPLEYNLVAALIPLAAWEALERGRLPLVTAVAALAGTLVFGARLHVSAGFTSALAISFTAILGAYLARHAFNSRPNGRPPLEKSPKLPTFGSGVPA